MRAVLITAALAATMALHGTALARDLTIIGWGGAPQNAQREAYFKPFTAETGIPVIDDSWNGGIGVLRTRVEAGGDPGWDVVEAEAEEVLVGCAEGLFEPIDWSKIPQKDELIPAAVSKCGVGAITWSTGIAYDADKLGAGPVTVADFFDLERFPGKRAIRKGPKYALELALIGDGVPADEVYKVLSTPEGVDRAFAKLETIKPELLYFESGAQSIQLLASGEAAMVLAFNARITAANETDKRNFKFIWPGSIYAVDSWVVLRNSPNKEAALKFLEFASRAKQQEIHSKLVAYGPTNTKALDALPEDVAEELPTYGPNMQGAISLDAGFWADNIQPLTERFNLFAAQ
ncbi:ABC transporter substrate-binding protein [Rhodoligotrophos defluvii]|uniref:ABC transporter substrate-binding protein n=1 Tax=Rhodoligotrophos defluvii TaxID=2561934 RepID=UPI0010CA15A7|nr:ABC transporter substrate-binding protein [Rhodoligotrophos defluvii]